MGGGAIPKIPDYRIYKIDGIQELELTQRLLAARGLKDPWLRNEVWRYTPENFTRPTRSMLKSMGRGAKWAVPAMLLTIAAEKAFNIANPKSGHDGHH